MLTYLFFLLISLILCDQNFLSNKRILAPTQQSLIPDQRFDPGQAFSFSIPGSTFTSSSLITYTSNLLGGSPLPSWMNFNAAGLTYSGTIPSISGNLTIELNAIDSQGTTHASFQFSINNIQPTIQAQNSYYSMINTFFSLHVNISDPNSDTLQSNLKLTDGSDIPSWLSWTSANSSISGLSIITQVLTVRLSVSDGIAVSTKDILLSINPTLTNTETIRDMIIYLTSEKYNWQVPYSAYYGFDLSYSINTQSAIIPSWFNYTANSNKFSINKHKNNRYPLNLSLSVTDSASQALSTNFTVITRTTHVIQDLIATDFALNTTPDQQTIDYLVLLQNQNIFMIWESYLEDGSDFGIYGKIIDAQGHTVVAKFRINTYTDSSQSFPQYTLLLNGSILVVWESIQQDGSNTGLYSKIFDVNGNVIRDEFQVNSWTNNEQSTVSVITLDNGNLFFTWQSYEQDGSKYGVYGRIISQTGSDIQPEFQINEWTADSQKNAKISKLPDGSVLVLWISRYQDGDGYGVYGKIFTENGNVRVPETKINSYTTGDQVNPSILSLHNNNSFITWESYLQDGSMDGLYGLIIDSSFNIVKPEFRVNDYTNLEQRTIQMIVLPNNNIFIAWESQRQPSNNFGIFAKIISQNGDTVVSEFHINDFYLANQGFCQVAVIDKKLIFVGWESQGQDASGDGIYYKLFDFNGNSITTEQRLNNYVGGWQINLKLLNLPDKKLLLAWNRDVGGYDFDCYGQIKKLDYNLIPDVLCSDISISADSTKKFVYQVDPSCFLDYDGSQLDYSSKFSNGTSLPNWISYNSSENYLSGLIPENIFDSFSLSILAYDDYGDSNDLIINITNNNVKPNNDATSSEGNSKIMIGAAAGGGLLALLLIIYLIRRRKKIKSEKTVVNSDASKIQPEQSPRENEVLTNNNREQVNTSRNPFITTNVPQRFLCPLTKGIMSEPWIVKFTDDTQLTFEKTALFNYFNQHQTIPVKNKPKKSWEENVILKSEIENYLCEKSTEDFIQDRDLMLKTLEWTQLRGRLKLLKNQRLKRIVEEVERRSVPG